MERGSRGDPRVARQSRYAGSCAAGPDPAPMLASHARGDRILEPPCSVVSRKVSRRHGAHATTHEARITNLGGLK
jgi:hypothetical protein